MAPVDVETTATVNRPRAAVASFAMDPDNVTRWYAHNEVLELVPGRRFVPFGPFPRETTYTWHDALDGATQMRLRNRGRPTGFSVLFAPFMAFAMRRANRRDLSTLKAILDDRGRASPHA